MADVRLTATNPEDSSVVPVACDAAGRLLLEEPQVIEGPPGPQGEQGPPGQDGQDGDPFSGNFADDVTFGGSASFAEDVTIHGVTVGLGGGSVAGNTAVGDGALFSNAIGNKNAALGQKSGFYIEGSNNTILGAYEGTSADASLNKTVIISAGPTERVRIDENGTMLLGTSTSRTNFFGGARTALFLQEQEGSANRFQAHVHAQNNGNGPSKIFAKHRGTTGGTPDIVFEDDQIGQISFQGSDGTNFIAGAHIQAEVDGTPGANDMPGRLVFSTTASGASTPTERMRINSSGDVLIGGGAKFAGNKAGFTAEGYLWCTTSRGDTVMLDFVTNGMGQWVEYTPTSRLQEIRDKLDANRGDTGEMPADTP